MPTCARADRSSMQASNALVALKAALKKRGPHSMSAQDIRELLAGGKLDRVADGWIS